MISTWTRVRLASLAVTAVLLGSTAAAGTAAAHGGDHPNPHDNYNGIYLDPDSSTARAAAQLTGRARADAKALSRIPSASWFTGGTPAEVRAKVSDLVGRAARVRAVPVLVAYNIPYRDCSQYSAGGAADSAAYAAWIQAFAAGISHRPAIVILEPDGLGIIPWHVDINGNTEWCQPADADPATAAPNRFAQLSAAVDALKALPRTSVYLDGTGSSWLSPGDTTLRLRSANIAKADGFFVNVSNYESDDRLAHYARWVSDCLALTTMTAFPAQSCQSQYWPATFTDTSTWTLTDATYDQAFADTGLTRDPAAQKKAVVDTSRNALGSWTPPAGKYTDAEVWCNPPGRGLGARPSLHPAEPYVAARLWVKVPGESDGRCFRGTGGPLDPERGMEDPAAGAWFSEQARELIELAVPPLRQRR